MAKKRVCFSVPDEDSFVLSWLDMQDNIGVSIRQLIREDIRKNGFTDVTCRDFKIGSYTPKKPRTRKKLVVNVVEDTDVIKTNISSSSNIVSENNLDNFNDEVDNKEDVLSVEESSFNKNNSVDSITVKDIEEPVVEIEKEDVSKKSDSSDSNSNLKNDVLNKTLDSLLI